MASIYRAENIKFAMSVIRWAVCLSVCVVLGQDDPYCGVRYQRLCQGKGPHVACQYPFRGAGPSCENYTSIIFSNDLKQSILHYINRRRQKIASGQERVRGGVHLPKPEIMMFVQWDRELAYLAQRLADQCQFVHDDCRATVRYPYAGQTVGEVRWRRSDSSQERGVRRTIGRVFDAWWGERRRVHAKQLISPFVLTARGAVWGHFSQLAVWTLRAMGCGAVQYGATRPRLLLVCDFSHTNMLGQRTISPGPLAPCPALTTRSGRPYPLLCAPPPIQSKQVVPDNGADDAVDDEDDDDDAEEDDEESEQMETRRSPITEKSANYYPTRPWPNRPVRPVQDETVDTDDQAVRQQQSTETITQPLSEQYRTMDPGYQPDRQQYRIMDTNYQPYRQEHRIKDTDLQDIRKQYTTMDFNNQPLRQYKTVDVNRRSRPIQEARPLHDYRPIKPLQDSRPIDAKPIQQDDDTDYRYIRPQQDVVVGTDRPRLTEFETVRTNRPAPMDDYRDMDRPNRPIKVNEADRDTLSVIPVNVDGSDYMESVSFGRLDDDSLWRQNTVTQAVRVSVKYRDYPDSVFRQKFNEELNSRNRDSQFQNRRQGPQNIQSNLKKPLHKIGNYRTSEMRLKGEHKAYNGYPDGRKDMECNRIPFQNQRWGDEETKLQDMSAVLPMQKQTYPPVQQVTTLVVYRPTSLYSIQTEPVFRQRWMQTKVRPGRPGASALLQNVPTSNPPHFVIKVTSKKSSLMLDKDDEEQLYQDTGFKLSTTKR